MLGNRSRLLSRVFSFLFIVFLMSGGALASMAVPASLYNGMKWRLIGPFRGSRVLAVAGVPSEPNTYYFGSVDGGIWKTTNNGMKWTPLFNHQSVASIGALAVAPSNPDVIYAGTGEAAPREDISFGDGVYKSTDAGKTWHHIGLTVSRHIGKIVIDPNNPNIVLVAALGHVYGPNKQRGVFRTADGGKTWKKVLYENDHTGAIDLALDPANPKVVYAAMWQMYRKPWHLSSGGRGSGLYKSEDNGKTWRRLSGHGLPSGVLGKIGVSIAGGSHGKRVYALIEAKHGGLYRSDDGGQNWQLVNSKQKLTTRAWYFTRVFASPVNQHVVYVADNGFYRSKDSGKTFHRLPIPGVDNHGFWMNPIHPDHMIESHDQGVVVSVDGGKTWSKYFNQPIGQFYHVSTDNEFPYNIYAAQQDEGALMIASRGDGGISRSDWKSVGGDDAESGYVFVDPTNENFVIAGGYGGALTRYNKRTSQIQDIAPWSNANGGHPAAHLKYRFTWTSPIAFSPQDPHIMYMGAQYLLETKDHGMSWQRISPDLTRNDKHKQRSSGGPLTQDNASAEYYDVIYSIAPSPLKQGQIWIGTDDGLVKLTRDSGKHWINVTPRGLPKWAKVSQIDASPFSTGTAYVAVDAHKLDDYKPYIFRTTDYGKSWTKITSGIKKTAFVRVVREDPVKKHLLYAGTETGIYVSFDNGNHWQSLQLNLPTTSVRDLAIHKNDLIAATHGRSIWVLDDIAPLRRVKSAAEQAAYLYQPQAAVRMRTGINWFQGSAGNLSGDNPPDGAIIDYYLKRSPQKPIVLKILDKKGRLIQHFKSKRSSEKKKKSGQPLSRQNQKPLTEHAGMNRFVWNLRYRTAPAIPGAAYDERSPLGVLVPPGYYTVKLEADGRTYTQRLKVVKDPRVKTSQANLAKQFKLAMRAQFAMAQNHAVVHQILDLRKQLVKREAGLAHNARMTAELKQLDQKAANIENVLYQSKAHTNEELLNYPVELNARLSYLKNEIDKSDTRPTKQSYAEYHAYRKRLDRQIRSWRAIKSKDLEQLNKNLRRHDMKAVQLGSKPDERMPSEREWSVNDITQ